MRPELDQLARQLAETGITLLVPSYLPAGLELAEIGSASDDLTDSARPRDAAPGDAPRLRYEVPDQPYPAVWVDLIQFHPPSDDTQSPALVYPAIEDGFRVPQTSDTRVTTYPDGREDPIVVPDAGFIHSFQQGGDYFIIEGATHRCAGPGCFTSWCTDDDCPKFPEPVARAIITSLEPYNP